MDNYITWGSVVNIYIWVYTVFAVISGVVITLLLLFRKKEEHFTPKPQRQAPSQHQLPKNSIAGKYIVETKADSLTLTFPPQPPPQQKNIQMFDTIEDGPLKIELPKDTRECIEKKLFENLNCQNYMPSNGKCTSFVCTKIVRFK